MTPKIGDIDEDGWELIGSTGGEGFEDNDDYDVKVIDIVEE